MNVPTGSSNRRAVWILGGTLAMAYVGKRLIQHAREEDLTGQVALITGGTSGLGFLLAREFTRAGCRVAICARDDTELRQARDELERDGADVLAIACDVADRTQVDDMIQRATSHFGRIDVLVNNAGIIQVGPVESLELKDFEDAMRIMFWGTVYPTLAVLPQMRARRSGRIVNITSIGGKVSVPHLLPYDAAKFAATGFSEGLRPEIAGDGISVTTIVPGLMRTGSFLNAAFKGQQEKEYVWFGLGSALPLVSMDAERAARQIVQATRRREAERILSVPANIIAKMDGVAPGATQFVLGVAERFILPEASGESRAVRSGREVQGDLESEAFETATALGQDAASRLQPDEDRPPEAWQERQGNSESTAPE